MSAVVVTPKPIIDAQYAPIAHATAYTCPASTKAIIDKFTVTNIDSVARTFTLHIVPNGGSYGNSNIIISNFSIAAGECHDFTELKNQVLQAGDVIDFVASNASVLVVRGSARECV